MRNRQDQNHTFLSTSLEFSPANSIEYSYSVCELDRYKIFLLYFMPSSSRRFGSTIANFSPCQATQIFGRLWELKWEPTSGKGQFNTIWLEILKYNSHLTTSQGRPYAGRSTQMESEKTFTYLYSIYLWAQTLYFTISDWPSHISLEGDTEFCFCNQTLFFFLINVKQGECQPRGRNSTMVQNTLNPRNGVPL